MPANSSPRKRLVENPFFSGETAPRTRAPKIEFPVGSTVYAYSSAIFHPDVQHWVRMRTPGVVEGFEVDPENRSELLCYHVRFEGYPGVLSVYPKELSATVPPPIEVICGRPHLVYNHPQ